MRALLVASLVALSLAGPVSAAPPDAQAVVQRMQAALEPAKPGARRFTLTLTQGKETVQITVGEARKQVAGSWRVLITALAPAGLQGMAYLVQDGGPRNDIEWFYLPYVRRVRKVASPEAYSAFLNSDFTYADLGFVDTGATYTLLGEGTEGGVKTVKLQGVPKESWYYARWVTTVNAETGMPIVREIYDTANQLWKRQRWSDPMVVDGITLPGAISMEDVQLQSRTDVRMVGADYDVALTDDLFDPERLPSASASPVWASVGK